MLRWWISIQSWSTCTKSLAQAELALTTKQIEVDFGNESPGFSMFVIANVIHHGNIFLVVCVCFFVPVFVCCFSSILVQSCSSSCCCCSCYFCSCWTLALDLFWQAMDSELQECDQEPHLGIESLLMSLSHGHSAISYIISWDSHLCLWHLVTIRMSGDRYSIYTYIMKYMTGFNVLWGYP